MDPSSPPNNSIWAAHLTNSLSPHIFPWNRERENMEGREVHREWPRKSEARKKVWDSCPGFAGVPRGQVQTLQQTGMRNGVLLRPGLHPCHLVLVLIQDVVVENKQAVSPGLYAEAGEQREKESSTQLCSAKVAHHLREWPRRQRQKETSDSDISKAKVMTSHWGTV